MGGAGEGCLPRRVNPHVWRPKASQLVLPSCCGNSQRPSKVRVLAMVCSNSGVWGWGSTEFMLPY